MKQIFISLTILALGIFPGVSVFATGSAPACPFEHAEGRTIVHFNDRLRSDKEKEIATSDSISINVNAGTYAVTLFSSDGYSGRSKTTQPHEQWFVEFHNENGLVANSGTVADIPDNVESATVTQTVNDALLLSENISFVVAHHAVYPDKSNPNSVNAICAAFDRAEPEEEPEPEPEPVLGSITVCKLITDKNGAITDGADRSGDSFAIAGIHFAGTEEVPAAVDILPTTVFSAPLTPNTTLIENKPDAECSTHNNLILGSYYYGTEDITASETWSTPLYNDQHTISVSTIDDFFVYSGELFTENKTDDAHRNTNADGHIVLTENRPNRTLIILNTYEAEAEEEPENQKPVITLIGETNVSIEESGSFTDPGATANDAEDGDITSDIIIAGDIVHAETPGIYAITYNVTDSAGAAADEVTRIITVNSKPLPPNTSGGSSGGGGGCVSGCGGSGGGGTKINLEITNEAITLNESGAVVITWDTNLQATSLVAYDSISHGSSTDPFLEAAVVFTDYAHQTVKDTSYALSHSVMISGLAKDTPYYFRPYSDRTDEHDLGIELTIVPATTIAESPLATNGATLTQPCTEYLLEYIKLGETNTPGEVRKLETFLNLYENASVPVNGIYEQGDFDAVRAFQKRYFADILAPWGHTEATGYVYYTTRKKINEIVCGRPFPLSASQLAEVEEFRALLERLYEQGESLESIDTGSIGLDSENTSSTSVAHTEPEQETGSLLDAVLATPVEKAPEAKDAAKNQTARIVDTLKNRSRLFGIILILLSFIIGGIGISRARKNALLRQESKSSPPDDNFPPII
jgi:hypothetical protein